MLGSSHSASHDRSNEDTVEILVTNEDTLRKQEEMNQSVPRNSRSKRNSGFFDVGYSQTQTRTQEQYQGPGVQRRTSKRASSQDRHGQVYGDDVPGFRPETPEVAAEMAGQRSPPREKRILTSPRRMQDTGRPEILPLGQYITQLENEPQDQTSPAKENGPRPRTRTLEERVRSRSPQTNRNDSRQRMGSFQSVNQLPLQEDPNQGKSIGFPSIGSSSQNMSNSNRIPIVRTSPRALSPVAHSIESTSTNTDKIIVDKTSFDKSSVDRAGVDKTGADKSNAKKISTYKSDAQRILALMRETEGRMHGNLHFRFSQTSQWQSAYCAINLSAGCLTYQTKGELAQTKVLIQDLRGCKVRTQFDFETETHFLDLSTKAALSGIHLKPVDSKTFEPWLAAFLYWLPAKAIGSRPGSVSSHQKSRKPEVAISTTTKSWLTPSENKNATEPDESTEDQTEAERYRALRDSQMLKTAKVLWWDSSVPQFTSVTPSRRISTYKQQRMSAGPPWRKATASVRENGFFEITHETKDKEGKERSGMVVAALELKVLKRYAIQRLHASVLNDEFSLAIYTQYKKQPEDSKPPISEEDLHPLPVFLSFETRVLLETWYAMFRAFTSPELYGLRALSKTGDDLQSGNELIAAGNSRDVFRVKRSLFLRVTEAQLQLGSRLPTENVDSYTNTREDWARGDYHAEVRVGNEIRGRTSIQYNTGNPFWRQDYEFNHLPPFAATVSVLIYSRQAGQREWTLVTNDDYVSEDFTDANRSDTIDVHVSPLDSLHGSVELDLNDMERGIESEKWWVLLDENGTPSGRVLLKARVDETVVLVNDEYQELGDLLHAFSNGIATETVAKCNEVAGYIPETLLNIFQVSESAGRWITTMIEDEIDNLQREVSSSRYRFSRRIASNDSYDSGVVEREVVLRDMGKSASAEANLLFRGNTPLTKALETHMRRLGKEYLEEVLGEHLRDIDESEPECEVDPNRVQSSEALQRNRRNLILLTESIWRSIKTSTGSCPSDLRHIFRHIRACTEDKYGAYLRTVAYSSVSAFLFLRFLVPAILNPSLFGLLKEIPRPKSRRTLTLIAKSLQALANMTSFGTKEPWMEPMNAFLNGHRQEFKDFINEICGISQERSSQASRLNEEFRVPIHMAGQLSTLSREGFPSLPYLIDQPREFAVLVNAWTDSRGQGNRIQIINEDTSRMEAICTRLRRRTREVLAKAIANGESHESGNDWNRLLKQLDNREKRASMISSSARSPDNSSSPLQDDHLGGSNSARNARPQPIRTFTAPSASASRSPGNHESQPPSAGSLGEFALAAVAGVNTPLVTSPSTRSFTGSQPTRDSENDNDTWTQSETRSNWDPTETESFARARMSSTASGGTGGYIHHFTSADARIADHGHSKTSSIRSVDSIGATISGVATDGSDYYSSALPESSDALGVDLVEPGPAASPRDSESRRFVDVFTFRRRDKKDETDLVRKIKKKEEKRREKEEKKKDKVKVKERSRGERTIEGMESPDGHRLDHGVIS